MQDQDQDLATVDLEATEADQAVDQEADQATGADQTLAGHLIDLIDHDLATGQDLEIDLDQAIDQDLEIDQDLAIDLENDLHLEGNF